MKGILMPAPWVLFQGTRLHLPAFAAQAILLLVGLQLPVIGYCDSGNGWFKNLFESKGKNMKELALTREVIIRDESGSSPEPQVISRAGDGGFIIAGSLGRAWAIKTDAAGKVLWRNLQDKPLTGGGYATAFTGAVAMPDGSTYLCGNTTGHPGKDYAPALLTHLDAAGQLLGEQFFLPQKRLEHGISYFDGCLRWGDGMMIVGHISQYNNIKEFGKNQEHYYWLLMLDSAGKVKWEKRLPTAFDTIDGIQSILVASDSSLVFAGRRSYETELFRISANGDLISKKSLAGVFQFVRPIVPDEMLQIYGFVEPKGDDTLFAMITLNEQLEEIHRTQGKQASNFSINLVYRMPDQSLAMFGRAIHSMGEQYASGIAHVDPTLQSSQKLELAHAPFYDGGSIDAATPTGNVGEFLTARKLLEHQPNEGRIGLAPVGIALDFIQVK